MASQAQVVLTGSNPSYTQGFNTLTATSTTGTAFINNSTIPGVFAARSGSNPGGDILADDGNNVVGNLYSYGVGTATERALGDVGSGNALAGNFAFGLYFRNNTAATLTSLTLTYTGEQWRDGGANAVQVVDFSYRVSSSAISTLPTTGVTGSATTAPADAAYTAVPALNFSSPTNSATATALNGNTSNRTTFTNTFAVNVPAGSYLMLRWNDPDHAGADDGLAIDDVTASFVTVVPSEYYTKAGAAPQTLASYGTNPDGSGTPPPNFTADNTTYHIANGAHTVGGGATWTVSGINSTVTIDNGSTLTVPNGTSNFSGPLALSANGTLIQQNAAPAVTFGAVDAASTIEYSRSANYTLKTTDIPGVGFGNLTLRNNTKVLPATLIPVRGNLLLDNLALNGAPTPFTTVALTGNLTAINTVTFPTVANRFTLLANNTAATQTLTGNGNTLSFFRLTTDTGSKGVVLANSTNLELGNTSSGGYSLATGSTLAVGNNTLSFYNGGKAYITSDANTTGTLVLTPPNASNVGSSLVFSAAYGGNDGVGTLLLDTNSKALNNLTVNLRGAATPAGNTLLLPNDLSVFGTLTLTAGRLGLTADKALNISGSLTVSTTAPTPLLDPSTGNSISFLGAGTISGTLYFTNNSTLGSLILNRDDVPVINIGTSFRTNSVTFTQGIILMATGTMLTANANTSVLGGSSTSYINALARAVVINNLTRTGAVSFPLGVSGNKYRPYVLNVNATAATGNATPYYSAIIFDGPPPTRTLPTTLKRVSSVRYYTVGPVAAAPANYRYTANITFGDDDYVDDLNTLRIAKSNAADNTLWDNIGQTNTTGSVSSGTITSGTFTEFSSTNSPTPTAADFVLATSIQSTNPLPVELTFFAGERTAAGVALRWTTASEHNSQAFVVERSYDGETFAPVATVAAAGTSLVPTAYANLDATAPATALYYRLKQVDFDGTTAYSKVVAIAGTDAARTAYPNPTTDLLTVPGAAGQVVEVTDALGRSVRRATPDANGQLSLGELPTGVYLLHVPGQRVQRIQKN